MVNTGLKYFKIKQSCISTRPKQCCANSFYWSLFISIHYTFSVFCTQKRVVQEPHMGTSLVVQWLRLHASNAGGKGSTSGQGTRIPHSQKQNKIKIPVLKKKIPTHKRGHYNLQKYTQLPQKGASQNFNWPRFRFRMLPVVDVLSVFVVTGVDTWGEKGFGLPDKLPACPVLVEAGEAEKAGYLLKDRFTNKGTYKACRCRVEKRVQKLYLISTRPPEHHRGVGVGRAGHLFRAKSFNPMLNR